MKKIINSGVYFDDKDEVYRFNYDKNNFSDIVNLVEPQLYESTYKNEIYWFGYQFNRDISSKIRSKFIKDLKGIGDNNLTDNQLINFIERPLSALHKKINIYTIDCFIYPLSNRSPLVSKMINVIRDYTSHETSRVSFEFVKSAPIDIQFDWESFNADYDDGSQRYYQMRDYIENKLLPAIHDLDYFSIAQCVKSKYRPYIKNYLNFKSDEDIEQFSKLQGSRILILDDINTTGSTLNEILRILNKINSDCEIYIFTLIGR